MIVRIWIDGRVDLIFSISVKLIICNSSSIMMQYLDSQFRLVGAFSGESGLIKYSLWHTKHKADDSPDVNFFCIKKPWFFCGVWYKTPMSLANCWLKVLQLLEIGLEIISPLLVLFWELRWGSNPHSAHLARGMGGSLQGTLSFILCLTGFGLDVPATTSKGSLYPLGGMLIFFLKMELLNLLNKDLECH